jgi:hypothetical protein
LPEALPKWQSNTSKKTVLGVSPNATLVREGMDKTRPYKTSFRAKLDIFSQKASQERDGGSSQVSPSAGPRCVAEEGNNHVDTSEVGCRKSAEHVGLPVLAPAKDVFVDGDGSESESDCIGFEVGTRLQQAEEAPEFAGAAEDLVLWPPPGQTLPAGAAPEAVVPAVINARLLPHQVRLGARLKLEDFM